MSWKPTIPISPFLPNKPDSDHPLSRVITWARDFSDALYQIYVLLSQRADQVVIDTTTANLPEPTGKRQIILAEDDDYRPFYDAGGAALEEILATPRAHGSTHAVGAADEITGLSLIEQNARYAAAAAARLAALQQVRCSVHRGF